ncbi:MAG: type II secretion system minor pseudopilin GspH [Gammaproteobacteria bacterium]|nr:type II secretion system minor pseudopilin GspH [Gammaproteobacteria bacterium]
MIKQKGFTLIELLIVIVIISIVSSVALITLSYNQNKNIKSFANQLIQVMTLAEHEALLRPITLGLGFTEKSYQFYQYDSNAKWIILKDNYLKPHFFSTKIQIALKINNQTIALNGAPSIVFSENSDITPFVILLGEWGKSPSYQIIGDATGALKVEPLNE